MSQSTLTVCALASHAQPIILSCMVGFENYLAQIIIKPRQCVLCKNHVATSKVSFTVRTYSLCIGLNETYLCPAHNFVVGPASGMMRYKDLVFHTIVRSHQGAISLSALGGGISVLWTHFFSSQYIFLTEGVKLYKYNIYIYFCEIRLFDLYFPQFCRSDMSKYGYLKVLRRVPSTSR